MCKIKLLMRMLIINPRRACAARATVYTWFVRVPVCLCVDAYSRTTGCKVAYKVYKRVQIYEGLNIKKEILLKRLRSGDME